MQYLQYYLGRNTIKRSEATVIVSTSSQRYLYSAISVFLTMFLFSSSVAIADTKISSEKPRKIILDVPNAIGCYKWSDAMVIEGSENIPRLPSFEAKSAIVSPCNERHYFEIYALISDQKVKNLIGAKKSIGYYCGQLALRKSKNSMIAQQEIKGFYTASETTEKKYMCALTGKTYKDSLNKNYSFYAALFAPEFKVNNQN